MAMSTEHPVVVVVVAAQNGPWLLNNHRLVQADVFSRCTKWKKNSYGLLLDYYRSLLYSTILRSRLDSLRYLFC